MNETLAARHPMRILGVFAHPDDESFCAGGTLARYAALGAEVMVVSATRGEAGQIRSAGVATRHTLGQVREQELYLACQRLGVQHAVCLDYGDGRRGTGHGAGAERYHLHQGGSLSPTKGEAIAAHRSQFPIQPDLLPLAILQALIGQEYFVPVSLVSEVEPEFLALQGTS